MGWKLNSCGLSLKWKEIVSILCLDDPALQFQNISNEIDCWNISISQIGCKILGFRKMVLHISFKFTICVPGCAATLFVSWFGGKNYQASRAEFQQSMLIRCLWLFINFCKFFSWNNIRKFDLCLILKNTNYFVKLKTVLK